jgi:hypothetical protein
MLIGAMPSTNRKDGGMECEAAFSPLTLCTDTRRTPENMPPRWGVDGVCRG